MFGVDGCVCVWFGVGGCVCVWSRRRRLGEGLEGGGGVMKKGRMV